MIKKLAKKLAVPLVCFVALSSGPKKAQSCVGARAIGMGGAYVSVAQGAEASYWNPAGLPQLKTKEIDTTLAFRNNYVSYSAFGSPFKIKNKKAGYALAFTVKEDTRPKYCFNSVWLSFSYGAEITSNFLLGVTAKLRDYFVNSEGIHKLDFSDAKDNKLKLMGDLGMLYKTKHFNAGVLIQNLQDKATINLRPGISYNNDLLGTTLSVSCYDSLNNFKDRRFKFGIEQRIKNVMLRGGYDRNIRLGFGFDLKNLELNYAYIPEWGSNLIQIKKRF